MGAIPSGSDPSGFDASQLEGTLVGAGLSALAGRTHDAVVSLKKAEVAANLTWKGISDLLFAGLDPDGSAQLPLLILRWIGARFGITDALDTMDDAVTAFEAWAENLPGIGGIIEAILGIPGDVHDLTVFIAGKWSDLTDSTSKWAALIAGVSGTTITDVVTRINDAKAKLDSLISGVGGTVITDVTNAITAAVANAQGVIDALINLVSNGTGHGLLADLLTKLRNGLSGLLPAVTDNHDGTAAAVSGLTFHHDGTATFVQKVDSVYTLVDNFDGTATTLAKTLQNMANGGRAGGNSLSARLSAGMDAGNKFLTLFSATAAADIAALAALVNNGVSAFANVAYLINHITGASTIADVVNAINSATQLWSDLFSQLSASVVSDVVAIINKGVTALGNWSTLLSNLGLSTVADIAAAIGKGITALTNWQSLFSGLGAVVMADLVALINKGITALSNWNSLFSGLGSVTVTDVVNLIKKGIQALQNWQDLLSGLGAVAVADIVALVQRGITSLQHWDDLIAALGKTVVGDAIAVIQKVVSDAQGIIDAIINWLTGGNGSGGAVASILGLLRNAFKLHLPPILHNGDGTASPLAGFHLNGDGTATFVQDVESDFNLIFNRDGTATSAAQTLATIAKNAERLGHSLGKATHAALVDVPGTIDSFVQSFDPSAGDGNPFEAIGDGVRTGLQNVLAPIRHNFDGTATALTGISFNGDGTAFFQAAEDSAHHLVDNLDGTASPVAKTFKSITDGAAAFGQGLRKFVHQGQDALDAIVGGGTSSSVAGGSPDAARTVIAGMTANVSTLQALMGGAYGAGASALVAGELISGSLPADFTALTPGSTAAANAALYNSAAFTDSQRVVGFWPQAPSPGQFYYLFLRASTDMSTYVYAKIGVATVQIVAVAGGVSWSLYSSAAAWAWGHYAMYFAADNYDYSVGLLASTGAVIPGFLVTDTSHHSLVGSPYRYAGFGTDEGSIPGVISEWTFRDTAFAGPAGDLLVGPTTWPGTSYVEIGLSVEVVIGQSGMAMVFLSGQLGNVTQANDTLLSYQVDGPSGLTAGDDSKAISYRAYEGSGAGGAHGAAGLPILENGLAAGLNTFALVGRVTGSTGSYQNCRLAVIPL